MKTTSVGGTVAAFYFYRNVSSEIDVESLSKIQNPWQTYFAIQPQIYEPDGSASNITHEKHTLDFNPTEAFHEYRFDWSPGAVNFYIDGQYMRTMNQNVPSSPGRLMINHWSDGNPNFSGGPPAEEATLEIANLTLFFNSSEFTAPPVCHSTQEPCNVSGN
ncbi:hypothetical protein EC973_005914 [Apophysomyces ossiformis]|uniref:GH16 domain-containing protein n=1 Tax=Apophysomyces ossiformis TaxID=679940 RepID=A0A8H7BDJ7_9FUNG|nr:hypothetical protein EC973_005914 [Apophysomyces ossiformis]